MLFRTWFLKLICLFLAFIIGILFAGSEYLYAKNNPGITPALKSLLFPGLGQIHNQQKTKGIGFIIIASSLIFATGYLSYSTLPLWDEHKKARTDSSYSDYASRCSTVNLFVGLTISYWLFNVYDAYSNADLIQYGLKKGSNASSIEPKKQPEETILELDEEFEIEEIGEEMGTPQPAPDNNN